jgi:hypothetical protein
VPAITNLLNMQPKTTFKKLWQKKYFLKN